MTQHQTLKQEELEEILNSAIDLTENRVSYITHVRFRVSNVDITVDFFYVAPDFRDINGKPVAQRTHRIIMPLSLAKNIGELLVQATSDWEATMGVSLPLLPQGFDIETDDEASYSDGSK
jgi:hypothetical protein